MKSGSESAIAALEIETLRQQQTSIQVYSSLNAAPAGQISPADRGELRAKGSFPLAHALLLDLRGHDGCVQRVLLARIKRDCFVRRTSVLGPNRRFR